MPMTVSKETERTPIPVGEREDGSTWHVVFQVGNKIEEFPRPTAVCIMAFYQEKVIAVETPRGWGIPSGHIESDESWKRTAERELLEEACAVASLFSIQGAMISDFYSEPTSILITTTEVRRLLPFKPEFEVTERKVVTPEELIELYYGNKDVIRGILTIAQIENQQR